MIVHESQCTIHGVGWCLCLVCRTISVLACELQALPAIPFGLVVVFTGVYRLIPVVWLAGMMVLLALLLLGVGVVCVGCVLC